MDKICRWERVDGEWVTGCNKWITKWWKRWALSIMSETGRWRCPLCERPVKIGGKEED